MSNNNDGLTSDDDLMRESNLLENESPKQKPIVSSKQNMRVSIHSGSEVLASKNFLTEKVKLQKDLETQRNENQILSQKSVKLQTQLNRLKAELEARNSELTNKHTDLITRDKDLTSLVQELKKSEHRANESQRTLEKARGEISHLHELLREEKMKYENVVERSTVQKSEFERKILKLQEAVEYQLKYKLNRTETKEINESSVNPFGLLDTQPGGASQIQNLTNLTFNNPYFQPNESQLTANEGQEGGRRLSGSFLIELKDGGGIDGGNIITLEGILKNHRVLWGKYLKLKDAMEKVVREKRDIVSTFKKFVEQVVGGYRVVIDEQEKIRKLLNAEGKRMHNEILTKKLSIEGVEENEGSDLGSVLSEKDDYEKNEDLSFENQDILPELGANTAGRFAHPADERAALHRSDRQYDGPAFLQKTEKSMNVNRMSLETDKMKARSLGKDEKIEWFSSRDKNELRRNLFNDHSKSNNYSSPVNGFGISKEFHASQEANDDRLLQDEDGSIIEHSCQETDCTGYLCAFKQFVAKNKKRLEDGRRQAEHTEKFLEFAFNILTKISQALRQNKIDILSLEDVQFEPPRTRVKVRKLADWEDYYRSIFVDIQNAAKRIKIVTLLEHYKAGLEPSLKSKHFNDIIKNEILDSFAFIEKNINNGQELDIVVNKLKKLEDRLFSLLRTPPTRESQSPSVIRPRRSAPRGEDKNEKKEEKLRILAKNLNRYQFLDFAGEPLDFKVFAEKTKDLANTVKSNKSVYLTSIFNLFGGPQPPEELYPSVLDELHKIYVNQTFQKEDIAKQCLRTLFLTIKWQISRVGLSGQFFR